MANGTKRGSTANVQGSLSGIEHIIIASRGERVILDRGLATILLILACEIKVSIFNS